MISQPPSPIKRVVGQGGGGRNLAGDSHFGSKGESEGGRKGLEEVPKVGTCLLGVNRNSYWLARGGGAAGGGNSLG